jgi:hypothetical protein
VRLADALLHGRLDVANGKDLTGFLDFACQPYPCVDGSKYYPLEPPGTALVILPGVALLGLEVTLDLPPSISYDSNDGLAINQTLVSVVIGAITAGVVYQVSRWLTSNLWHQLWLTAMFVFGTVYWWNAVYVGVWYFNHAVAALFLFAAVYETLVTKRPFTAGIFLGAAYITRLPTVWTFPFFVIMFTDWTKLRRRSSRLDKGIRSRWWPELRAATGRVLRISRPVLKFGAGLAIFVVGFAVLNYVRFDTASPQATYDQWHAKAQLSVPGQMLEHGLVSVQHFKRHEPIFFEKMFYTQSAAPYEMPTGNGAAFWATTPAFLFAFLAAIRNSLASLSGRTRLAAAVFVFFILPTLGAGGTGWKPWFTGLNGTSRGRRS